MHIKNSTMSSKEPHPRPSSSRRDHDRQRREAETPKERKWRLDRLKEYRKRKRESEKQEDADIRRLSLYNVLLMRCNFGLLGNINVIVKFCSASDIMHE